jgi:phage baseplate assembly protein V
MLRFGTISEVKPEKGLAKVNFAEDGIVSAWIPIVQNNTLGDKNYRSMKVNEHVACMMDEHCENGVIVGAIYNSTDTPPYAGEKVGVKFEDGTEIVYDKGAGTYTINNPNGKIIITADADVEITCTKLVVTGDVEVTGDVDVIGSIDSLDGISSQGTIYSLTDVTAGPTSISLTTHLHAGVTPGPSLTGPPTP